MFGLIEDSKLQAQRLMESVLREGASLCPEYPLIFDDQFSGGTVGVGSGGEVQSACTILARNFQAGDSVVRGGMIGSVSTASDARGRGLATRTLIEAEARLQIDGCAFVLLWGEEPSFYLKRGYCPTGVEYDFMMTPEIASFLPGTNGVREAVTGDFEAMRVLYTGHSSFIQRTAEEMQAMMGCPGMTALVLERNGSVVAYALRGRGADLNEAIHEWAGEPADVLALVRAHTERAVASGLQGLILMVPASATDMRVELGKLKVQEHAGILGLGKVLDRPATARMIDSCLGEHGSCKVVSVAEGECFEISGPKDCGTIDDSGALALMFPTIDVRPAVEEFLSRFGFEESLLPLSIFVWGLDSI